MTLSRTHIRRLAGVAIATFAVLGLAAPSVAQDIARGEEVFALCMHCHGVDGSGSKLAEAPAIAGLPAWFVEGQLAKFRDGRRGAHFDDITGMRMRPMSRSLQTEDDVKAVAAYVGTMPVQRPMVTLEGGDAAAGADRYKLCVACHAVDGTGNQALTGAPLVNLNDWYMLRQLEKFKAGIRGSNPTDIFATTMRPMALQLPDEQAMKDVIAYIVSLGQ